MYRYDGKEVARSGLINPELYDLSNNVPLRIGFGPNDYFNGSVTDLRYYDRALSPEEIHRLNRRNAGN